MVPSIWVENGCCYIPLGKSPQNVGTRSWASWGGHHTWKKISCSSATCIEWWLQNTVLYSGPLLGMEVGEA